MNLKCLTSLASETSAFQVQNFLRNRKVDFYCLKILKICVCLELPGNRGVNYKNKQVKNAYWKAAPKGHSWKLCVLVGRASPSFLGNYFWKTFLKENNFWRLLATEWRLKWKKKDFCITTRRQYYLLLMGSNSSFYCIWWSDSGDFEYVRSMSNFIWEWILFY